MIHGGRFYLQGNGKIHLAADDFKQKFRYYCVRMAQCDTTMEVDQFNEMN